MKNRYKLVVTDIDGTLVDKNGKISDIDRQAVNELRKAGVYVSLCTGRAARGCRKVLEELSLEGFHIFFDGALVCNADLSAAIYSQPVQAELMRQVCRFADLHRMALEVFTVKDFFISHPSRPASIHSGLMNYPPVITDFEKVCDAGNIIMGCIVTNSGEEEEKIKIFRSGFTDRLRFSWTKHPATPDYHYINITAAGISKGRAVEALIADLKLDKSEVMAIGDGANDVTLLSAAGLAIAMQNSPDDLKSVADYITPDIEHNGFAQAIRRFLAV
jgi:Cof subfamily protein (haloacid dehalogenase superfamily)